MWDDILTSNTNIIPGKKIIKTIGKVKIKHDATDFKKHAKWAFSATDKLKKIAL